jgi:lipoprotein-anchoring transpeptidase ErfK/SrfK
LGEHPILAKVPLVHYAGGTGADAYDLGWVPYNLRFYTHIYIHYAPWHNNFGHVMSHGCVNVSLDNMKWIYDWSDEGDAVIVHE